MTAVRLAVLPVVLGLLTLLPTRLFAQEQKAPAAYPTRDALSPFRNPQEIAAPPDALFAQLRTMRRIAEDPAAIRSFDDHGREIVDDETWRLARQQAEANGIDAGVLAALMRNSRNADERAVAFYAAFFSSNEADIFNLIAHLPGEPERKTRELGYPRAIAFVRANIDRKFGDLSPEQQQQILRGMPQPGSPAALARGLRRLPTADDTLFTLNLTPFFQLLDLDDPLDQAQGLWFLKECFAHRRDLAEQWLEPALPRLRQLLDAGQARVREQAIGLLQAIAPAGLSAPAADALASELDAFADQVAHAMFPPIRRVSEGLFLLFPSADRDAVVAAGRDALDGDRIGEGAAFAAADGTHYRGFRVDRVPEALAGLGIQKGAVITAINGTPVFDGRSVWKTIADQFFVRDTSKEGRGQLRPTSTGRLFVELMVAGQSLAIEYRVQ